MSKGKILRDAVQVLAGEGTNGKRGQVRFVPGWLMRELQERGFTHADLVRVTYLNSLLSIYPRKTGPFVLDYKAHGGLVIELPIYPGGYLGSKWHTFVGKGVVTVDLVQGDSGSMRLLMPSDKQLKVAADKLKALPHYPEFF